MVNQEKLINDTAQILTNPLLTDSSRDTFLEALYILTKRSSVENLFGVCQRVQGVYDNNVDYIRSKCESQRGLYTGLIEHEDYSVVIGKQYLKVSKNIHKLGSIVPVVEVDKDLARLIEHDICGMLSMAFVNLAIVEGDDVSNIELLESAIGYLKSTNDMVEIIISMLEGTINVDNLSDLVEESVSSVPQRVDLEIHSDFANIRSTNFKTMLQFSLALNTSCTNSTRYNPKKKDLGIRIRFIEDDEHLWLEVMDNGAGVDENRLKLLRECYVQGVKPEVDPRAKGSNGDAIYSLVRSGIPVDVDYKEGKYYRTSFGFDKRRFEFLVVESEH